MIYLCWLGSTPGGYIEIRRKLTHWMAKKQTKLGFSDRREMWCRDGRSGEGWDRAGKGVQCLKQVGEVELCPDPSSAGLVLNPSPFPV